MQNLPEIDADCTALYSDLYAPIQSRLLLVAIELNVFDVLTETASAEDVARALSTHPGNTRAFLDALVVAGFIRIFLNPATVARHLGTGRFTSVFKAALLGVPVPL
jgi:hypothetical protein